jgi:hypothetical protein
MKIELAIDLSTVANLTTRLSRPALLSVRYIRGNMFQFCIMEYTYLYILNLIIIVIIQIFLFIGVRCNWDKRDNIRGNSRGRGRRGGRKREKKMPNKDELDAQLDSFIKSNNN